MLLVKAYSAAKYVAIAPWINAECLATLRSYYCLSFDIARIGGLQIENKGTNLCSSVKQFALVGELAPDTHSYYDS